MARHDDHGTAVSRLGRPFPQERDAIGIGHPDIEQYQIVRRSRARRPRLSGVGGHFDLVALLAQDLLQQPPDIGLVVHHQNLADAHARSLRSSMRRSLPANRVRSWSLTGRKTNTFAPPSGRLSASMRPPCSSTIRLTMARPRPVPRGLPVTYGSKTRPSISFLKPGPLSRTEITAVA